MSERGFKINDKETNVVIPDMKNLSSRDVYISPNNAIKKVAEGVGDFLEGGDQLDGLSGGIGDAIDSISGAVEGVTSQIAEVTGKVQAVAQGVTSQVQSVVGQVQAQVQAVQGAVENTVKGVQNQVQGVVGAVQGQISSVIAPVDVIVRQAKGYGEQLQSLAGVPSRIVGQIGESSLGKLPGVKGALGKFDDTGMGKMLSRASNNNFMDFKIPTEKLDVGNLLDKATGGRYSSQYPLGEFHDLSRQFNQVTSLGSMSFDVGLEGGFKVLSEDKDPRVVRQAGVALLSDSSKKGNFKAVGELWDSLKDKAVEYVNPAIGGEIFSSVPDLTHANVDERLKTGQIVAEPFEMIQNKVRNTIAAMEYRDKVVESFAAENTNRSVDIDGLDTVVSTERIRISSTLQAGMV